MGRKSVHLSNPALDHLDFMKLAGTGMFSPGAVFASGKDIADSRIFALANLCQGYSKPMHVSDMVGQEKGSMVPPREVLHARGYYCHYSQTSPPLNVPDELSLIYLHTDDPAAMEEALQELYPRISQNGAIFIEGGGASHELALRFAGPEDKVKGDRKGDLFMWQKDYEESLNKKEDLNASEAQKDYVYLCYPNSPGGKFRMMCNKMGYGIIDDPTLPFDFGMKWIGETFTPNDIVIEELADQIHLVNARCEDISKTYVEAVHQDVFGYGLEVDPTQYMGLVVQKANLNAQCKESLIECPIDEALHGFTYQRLVITPTEPEEYEEYRVAITGREITYVVVKRRPVSERFNRSAGYALIKTADEIFNPEEQELIFEMSAQSGFEYGDLDILRDAGDGRIYIIDLNPTPGGPGGGYFQEQRDQIVELLTQAFQREFSAGLVV